MYKCQFQIIIFIHTNVKKIPNWKLKYKSVFRMFAIIKQKEVKTVN